MQAEHGEVGGVGSLRLRPLQLPLHHRLVGEGDRAALVEEEGVAPEHEFGQTCGGVRGGGCEGVVAEQELGQTCGASGEGDEGVVDGHTVLRLEEFVGG